MPDLLIELLSEEIPARMQEFAANELKKNMLSFLSDQGVSEIAATAYSTPRRLTLFMSGLPEKAPDINEERKGPRIDAPQQAVDGFLRSVDLNLDQLESKLKNKAACIVCLLYTSPSPRDGLLARMPSSA